MITQNNNYRYQRGEVSLKFNIKHIEQAIYVNPHFLSIILVGFFALLFSPFITSFEWVNESMEFISSLMLGTGISGILCWIFAFKIRGEVSQTLWTLCHILLNICHILSVLFFLFFFIAVGIRENGTISALACGIFSSMIMNVMLSMKYGYRNFQ